MVPQKFDYDKYSEKGLNLTTIGGWQVTQVHEVVLVTKVILVGVANGRIVHWDFTGKAMNLDASYNLLMIIKTKTFWFVYDPSVDTYPMMFSSEDKAADYRAKQMPHGVIKTLEFEVD